MRRATTERLTLPGEDDSKLEIYYDNRGEPFREGAWIELCVSDYKKSIGVFLEKNEVIELRDKLSQIIGGLKWI